MDERASVASERSCLDGVIMFQSDGISRFHKQISYPLRYGGKGEGKIHLFPHGRSFETILSHVTLCTTILPQTIQGPLQVVAVENHNTGD